ncbi:hypothetical protein HDK90DRAFT_500335 [Phyllosticta capitalensis]|uniref:Secreted protein n=1 Tax=Phyllosticta capitalensis TaxID=121624 RepID=A0ABR1Y8T4_9PEZI
MLEFTKAFLFVGLQGAAVATECAATFATTKPRSEDPARSLPHRKNRVRRTAPNAQTKNILPRGDSKQLFDQTDRHFQMQQTV